jgi:transcriptional regulator with XRE-family HTH domain
MKKDTVLIQFGDRLRQLRLAKGLSQEQLAELANVHRTYIGMLERAEKNITLKNIEKVAGALGLSISGLMRVEEIMVYKNTTRMFAGTVREAHPSYPAYGKKNIHIRLSQNLKRLLQVKGMTLETLAFEADINKSNLSRILSGKGGATLEMIQTIADSLKIDVSELFKA